MRSYQALALATVLAVTGWGCTPPESSSLRLDQFCEPFEVAASDPDFGDGKKYVEGVSALCQLWREGRITEREYWDFCSLDHESAAAYMDLEEYCTVEAEPEISGDFDTTVDQWRSSVEGPDCGFPDPDPYSLFTGECGDGKVFLSNSDGLYRTIDFYDGDSRTFVGQITRSDYVMPPCCGEGYWPGKIECADAIVTEVICGERRVVGDSVSFR